MSVTAYVGANGSGKTLLAVSDLIEPRLKGRFRDRPLVSSVPISKVAPDGYLIESVPLTSWEQLLELEGCDVFMDEVVRLASSRETGGLPPVVVSWLGMLRHHDVTVTWTAPAWGRADVLLREATQLAYECVPKLRVDQSNEGLRWRRTVLSAYRAYATDENQGGEWPGDDGRQSRLPKLRRLSKLPGYGAYPSRYKPTQLSEHSHYCSTCGLRRRTQYCNGKHSDAPASSPALTLPA